LDGGVAKVGILHWCFSKCPPKCHWCYSTETGVRAKQAFLTDAIANAHQNANGVCALKLVL
jgi:hypothetical protein